MKTLLNSLMKSAAAIAFAMVVSGCYQTTPHAEIEALVDDGFALTWTDQSGEYWDEFTAKEGKRTKTILVNRNNVKRDSNLAAGDANSVVILDDGTLEVRKLK
ncbi:MAG: hypothetical protein HKN23_20290 [Verrucomicrobiales bacterium]|nr:hypothetical protein [Verrucomicrobiales bacterium]